MSALPAGIACVLWTHHVAGEPQPRVIPLDVPTLRARKTHFWWQIRPGINESRSIRIPLRFRTMQRRHRVLARCKVAKSPVTGWDSLAKLPDQADFAPVLPLGRCLDTPIPLCYVQLVLGKCPHTVSSLEDRARCWHGGCVGVSGDRNLVGERLGRSRMHTRLV